MAEIANIKPLDVFRDESGTVIGIEDPNREESVFYPEENRQRKTDEFVVCAESNSTCQTPHLAQPKSIIARPPPNPLTESERSVRQLLQRTGDNSDFTKIGMIFSAAIPEHQEKILTKLVPIDQARSLICVAHQSPERFQELLPKFPQARRILERTYLKTDDQEGGPIEYSDWIGNANASIGIFHVLGRVETQNPDRQNILGLSPPLKQGGNFDAFAIRDNIYRLDHYASASPLAEIVIHTSPIEQKDLDESSEAQQHEYRPEMTPEEEYDANPKNAMYISDETIIDVLNMTFDKVEIFGDEMKLFEVEVEFNNGEIIENGTADEARDAFDEAVDRTSKSLDGALGGHYLRVECSGLNADNTKLNVTFMKLYDVEQRNKEAKFVEPVWF